MKVTVKATEVIDADVESISLVKNGANRIPFRILKAEDMVSETSSLADSIAKAFAKPKHPQVTSVIVRKECEGSVTVMMKSLGLSVDEGAVAEDLIIYKQEGFDDNATLFALNEDVAVGISGLAKEYAHSVTADFETNVKSMSFYPSMADATASLMNTIKYTMQESRSTEEASSMVDKSLSDFSKYVKSLVRGLPTVVFKMEELLRAEVEGSKVETSSEESYKNATLEKTDEENTMSTAIVKEAAPGDLDGLYNETPVQKSESSVVTSGELAAAAAVPAVEEVAKTEDAPVAEEVVEKIDADDAAIVATSDSALTTEAPVVEAEKADPLSVIAAAMQTMAAEISSLKKTVDVQNEKIDAASVTAAEAVEKADNTTVMTLNDIDESLSGLSRTRDLKKSDAAGDDVWEGVMPIFETL